MGDDDEKYVDLQETDIEPEELKEIEETLELVKQMMASDDPLIAWKMAMPVAVMARVNNEKLDDKVLKQGREVALYLSSDDIQMQKDNISKIEVKGWKNLEAALQSYLNNNPKMLVANMHDLRVATLVACYAMAGSNDDAQ